MAISPWPAALPENRNYHNAEKIKSKRMHLLEIREVSSKYMIFFIAFFDRHHKKNKLESSKLR